MSATVTPAMRQYLDAKQQHRDAILLFRMGDFYEIFYEDALVAARTLEMTLTSRSKDANGGGIPMCGVPFHAVDGYIARLVKRGFRVAICDQVEDPRKAKGIVKREVVRVVSPGTLTDSNYLDAREPAFIMAVSAPGQRRAVGWCDRRRPARSVHRRVQRRGIRGRRRPAGARRRARGAQAARDHRSLGRQRRTRGRRSRRSPPPDFRPRRSTAGRSSSGPRAGRCSISCAPAASKASASTAIRPPSPRPARSSTICARRRRSTSRTCARSPTASGRCAAHRPDDAEASRDYRRVRGRPRADRCSTSSIARSRRSAAGCSDRGCCVRWWRSSRSAIGSTRSRNWRSARPSAGSSATRSRRCRIWSGWWRARRSAPPARAISSV